jgi:coenzyme F420-reducing hydrogenase beta subunit
MKDRTILNKSSSGGVFAGLAAHIIEGGGVVFGCAFDKEMLARHLGIENKQDICKLQGSKYVASNTGDTFRQVELYLKGNRMVLYCGTPCQVAGLKAFLHSDYENLYTVDLICHGVPIQKLFSKYINFVGNKHKGKIIYYGFRDKDIKGWSCTGKYIFSNKAKNKTVIIHNINDPYYKSFLSGETYRPSCYKCIFANMHRIGDLTIGDFWSIEKYYPQFFSKAGNSLCIINNRKGLNLFTCIENNFEYIETLEIEALENNGNLKAPTAMPAIRKTIYNDIDNLSDKKYFSRFKYDHMKVFIYFMQYALIQILDTLHIKDCIRKLVKNRNKKVK